MYFLVEIGEPVPAVTVAQLLLSKGAVKNCKRLDTSCVNYFHCTQSGLKDYILNFGPISIWSYVCTFNDANCFFD